MEEKIRGMIKEAEMQIQWGESQLKKMMENYIKDVNKADIVNPDHGAWYLCCSHGDLQSIDKERYELRAWNFLLKRLKSLLRED